MIREIENIESANPFQKSIEFYEKDKVLGYLIYSHIYDRLEIDNLFVNEENRGNGIGKKLMSYLVWIAINNHIVNITLEVRKSNEIAKSLYKSFGFREVALRRMYYGDEDAILMEKQVM